MKKKIFQIIFKDLEKLNNKIDMFYAKQYALEEKIKTLEDNKLKEQMDEFEYADLQNDEKKLEALEQSEASKECERCHIETEEDEADLVDGVWLCRECEEESQ